MVQSAVWKSLIHAESSRERDALWRGIVATNAVKQGERIVQGKAMQMIE
jgi:hypothetical protein